MVRALNINKKDELRKDLKAHFPTITDAELDKMNESFDNLIDSISVKTHQDRQEVQRIVDESLEFINSKHLI